MRCVVLPRLEFDTLEEFDKAYARLVAGRENRYMLITDVFGKIAIQQVTTSSPQFVLVLDTRKHQYDDKSPLEVLTIIEKRFSTDAIKTTRISWSADTS